MNTTARFTTLLALALLTVAGFAQDVPPAPDETQTEELQARIVEVLDTEEPIVTDIQTDYISPEGDLTLMIELTDGAFLALEVDLNTVAYEDGSIIEISTNALAFAAVAEGGEVVEATRDEIPDLLTRDEEHTRVFCARTDGQGGTIAKAALPIVIDGNPSTAVVDLRMDAMQQADQQVLSDEIQWSDKRVWCISWFSDDCKKNKKGDCIPGRCSVTLSALIDVAKELGLELPGTKTIRTLTDLLADAGVSVGGDCRPVWFLGFIYVGCQCVLVTF